MNRTERQGTEWEEIFATHLIAKGHVLSIKIEFLQSHRKMAKSLE